MPLERNLDIAEYGSITIRLTPGAVEVDFLGFQVYLCDAEYSENSETLVGDIEDSTMAFYDFNLNKESGIYYFNCYSVDTNKNLSIATQTSIQIGRTIENQGVIDVVNDIRINQAKFERMTMFEDFESVDDFQLQLDWLKGGQIGDVD